MDVQRCIIYSFTFERRVSLQKNVRYAENVAALTIHGYRGNTVQHDRLIVRERPVTAGGLKVPVQWKSTLLVAE